MGLINHDFVRKMDAERKQRERENQRVDAIRNYIASVPEGQGFGGGPMYGETAPMPSSQLSRDPGSGRMYRGTNYPEHFLHERKFNPADIARPQIRQPTPPMHPGGREPLPFALASGDNQRGLAGGGEPQGVLSAPRPSGDPTVRGVLTKYFTKKPIVDGIMANIHHESRFNPNAFEERRNRSGALRDWTESDGAQGYGLFQFTGKHLEDYVNWLENGDMDDSMDSQVKFVHENIYTSKSRKNSAGEYVYTGPHNLGGKARGKIKDAFASNDASIIAAEFARSYENPKSVDQPQIRADLAAQYSSAPQPMSHQDVQAPQKGISAMPKPEFIPKGMSAMPKPEAAYRQSQQMPQRQPTGVEGVYTPQQMAQLVARSQAASQKSGLGFG